MTQEKKNEGGAPIGGAPGYGGVSEDNVGGQGTGEPRQQRGPSAPPERGRASGTGDEQSQPGSNANPGEAAPPDTPLFKEELLPEEKGTSLDEGGAG